MSMRVAQTAMISWRWRPQCAQHSDTMTKANRGLSSRLVSVSATAVLESELATMLPVLPTTPLTNQCQCRSDVTAVND